MSYSEVVRIKTSTNLLGGRDSTQSTVEFKMTNIFGLSNCKDTVAIRQNGEGCRWSRFLGKDQDLQNIPSHTRIINQLIALRLKR